MPGGFGWSSRSGGASGHPILISNGTVINEEIERLKIVVNISLLLVDPQARIVEAYVLSHGEYGLLGIYKDEDVIQSQVLAGIAIVANSLFV
jgi:hypothetical protein